ncbi:MAG: PadR family transcriptional regulator [Lachnospiraceae bacterium]|nr:PadR family transcriptional regulator [Lachnospiraceae bacterium]
MANTKKMDYVIMGLLDHEPLTGYEIKKRMDTTLRFFWGGSFGSIYPTLAELEKTGKVVREDASTNGREKISYSLTDSGRKALKEWLKEPVEKDEIRYETLLKLFFGMENGLDGTLEHINRFEEKIKSELPLLQMSVENLSHILEDDTHKYYYLTASFGVKTYEAYLEWCEEAKKRIEEWKQK